MCGIVAIWSRNAPIADETIEKATLALRHRGPDGQRHWTDKNRRVALGHARLSIIDLATGNQPIANEDETLRVVVNGEFYGYEGIQDQLVKAGHRLRTRSDSEITLHLYEDAGVRCLQQLRGEFAMVLWDSKNEVLFAARDRLGIKPLFYAVHEGAVYFASEVKALFAAGVPARWGRQSLYGYGWCEGPQESTLFDGIFQVPPGYCLLVTGEGVHSQKYWDFSYPRAGADCAPRPDAEYASEFHQALDEAVRIRLRADVPVGCYLSGGIDSCAILGLAARHHRGPIRAFTLTFDRPEYNEGEIARQMAAKAGADYFAIPVRQDDLADCFADAVVQSETLCVNAHGVAKYLLSRAVRDAGFKVVLTGEGSDEILGGYMHFRRDVNPAANGAGCSAGPVSAHSQAGTRESSHCAAEGRRTQFKAEVRRTIGFVPAWIDSGLALSEKIHAVLSEDYLDALSGENGLHSVFESLDAPGQLAGRDPLHKSLYLWAKTRLPNYILTLLGDRMEMAHSVEGRVPFLDHHFVETMRSQPITQKIRGAVQKYILRESLRDVVTDTVYRRHKHPFLSPPATLDPRGRLHMLLDDVLRGPILRSIPFFDQRRIVQLLDRLPGMDESERVANDQVLMVALSACVLQERFRLAA
jgi:asparagine synthase (glutamine-hydrolysing)